MGSGLMAFIVRSLLKKSNGYMWQGLVPRVAGYPLYLMIDFIHHLEARGASRLGIAIIDGIKVDTIIEYYACPSPPLLAALEILYGRHKMHTILKLARFNGAWTVKTGLQLMNTTSPIFGINQDTGGPGSFWLHSSIDALSVANLSIAT
jgi:hypothetical protein